MALDDITFTPQCAKYNGTRPTRPPSTAYTGSSTTMQTTTPTGKNRSSKKQMLTLILLLFLECAGYCQNEGVCTLSTTGDGKPTCT
jgi:hypothetical protein